jgi:outer membrane lipoprotein SlyB
MYSFVGSYSHCSKRPLSCLVGAIVAAALGPVAGALLGDGTAAAILLTRGIAGAVSSVSAGATAAALDCQPMGLDK